MPTTLEVPTLQELKVDEVNVSSAVLKAAAHHYGSQCDKPNKEFMLCRWEEKDPRKCIQEGRKVNECALNFFRFKNCMPAVICKTDPRSRAQRVIKDVAERWSQHSADFRSPYETGHKRQIKGNCAESFTEYWTCLDYTNLAELRHCRKQQQAFDGCVLDKLGWVRPDLGELSKVTKVSTSRPLPENPYHSRPRPEPNPTIEGKLEPAKHGSRLFFWTW